MKYYSLLILPYLILLSSILSAQDITVFESEPYQGNMVNIAPAKVGKGYISLTVENKAENWEDPKMNPKSIFNKEFNYTYISDEDNVYLSKLDIDLNIVAEKKLEFEDADDVNIYGLFHYEDRTTLYYSQHRKFNDEVYIYSMDIDAENLINAKPRKIHTIKYRNGLPATRLVMSNDSTKLAFISEKWHGDNDKVKLDIALFNIQGTPIWSDPVYLGAKSEVITFTDAIVDNTGNIFISYKLFEKNKNLRSSKNKKGDKVPSYQTRIITYGIDETEAFVSIKDQDLFLRKCDLIYNTLKEKVQIVGTYSIKDGGNLTGVFTADIDPVAMTSGETTFHKFDKKLIDLIDEDGFGQTKDKDPGVEIRTIETNIHVKDNGDLAYIIQPFKYEERFMNNNFRTNRMQNIESGYNIYSIIIAQISIDKIIFTRVPRRSNSMSFFGELIAKSVIRNDQVYLLYTDYYKNLERRDDENPKTMRSPSQSSLILANVDAEGNYYRSFLKNREEEDNFSLTMSDFYAVKKSEFMYTSYIGGLFSSNRTIGTVTFK